MNARALASSVLATASRWFKLVPFLFRDDPLFRYAAIAAVLALIFLGARLAQDITGPGTLPPAGQNVSREPAGSNPVDQTDDAPGSGMDPDAEPPLPGSPSMSPKDASPLPIAPGRSLENLEVEPAPRDRFGTLPQGESDP